MTPFRRSIYDLEKPVFYTTKELLKRNSKGKFMNTQELERIKKYEAAQRKKK